MPSDEESGTSVIVSEFETQFIPRSGDEEVLWAVQEITAERGKKYKVKWVGADPATGKSWPQSWVAKHDCTNDLVVEWKGKKKRLAEQKKRGEWCFDVDIWAVERGLEFVLDVGADCDAYARGL